MSPAKDQPPPPGGTRAERPRRSKLRIAIRVLVGLALALAVVVALAFVLLHAPAGRSAARVLLEQWGSQATGGRLRLGQLEVALWKGHAAATAVTFELPGTRIAAQRVSVDWPLGTRPQLLLLRPQVIVTDTGAPEAPLPAVGLAARPWQALERFQRVEVVEGRLELRDAKSAPWLVLSGLDAWSTEAGRRQTLRIGDADLGWPEGGLRLHGAALEGAFTANDGRLQVEQARITAGASSLELAGALERIQPLTARLSGRAAFDGALVATLAPGAELEGRVEAETVLDAKDDRLTGTLAVSSPSLRLSGFGPWSTTARGRLAESTLVVESLTALGYGGRLEASGPLALTASGRTEVELHATGFDPLVLARALQRDASQAVPVSTVASATLRLTTQGFDLEQARGTGQLTLQPGAGAGLKPTGGAGVRIHGRTIAIAGAHVEARGAKVTADGELGRDGALSGRFTAELPLDAVPALLADLGRPAKTPATAGRLLAEGEIRGPTSAPEVTARLRSEGLAVQGGPLGLEAEALYRDGRLAVTPVVLRSGRGQASLTGTVPLAPADEWNLAGDVDSLDIGPGLAFVGLDGNGPATGTIRVAGPRDEPSAQLSLRAEAHLRRAAGEPAAGEDDVVLQLEGRSVGGRVELERLEAQLAGGRVAGTARYDSASGSVAANLEASGLALERLPLVPAGARRVAGTLAGTLALAGSASAPAGELRLTLAEPRLDGEPLPPVALAASADGRELRVTGTSGTAEIVTGSGRLEGDWPLRLAIDVKALPYESLVLALPALKQADAVIAGSGSLTVELPLKAPALLRYASSELSFSGRLRRLEWRTSTFSLEGGRDSLQLAGFKLEAGKGWLTAHGTAGLAAASPSDLAVQAKLDFESLGPALAVRTFGGEGTLELHVGGTHESPQLDGAVKIVDLRGRIEGARVTDLDAEARFEGPELRVERLQASVLGGTATASGGIPLVAKAGAAASRFVFELKDVDLAQLMERELREAADSPTLLVSLAGGLQAEAPSLERMSASGKLTRFDNRSVEGALSLSAPVAWSLQRGVFTIEPIRLEGPLGQLEARFAGDASGAQAKGEASLKGAVDLRALSPFLPETSVSGPTTIDLRAAYGGEQWRLLGSVTLEKGRLSLDTLNFAATELAGQLRFDGERASLEATAVSSDGRLQARGAMKLGGSLLGTPDLELSAERVPLNYPAGFRGRAGGVLRLTGEPGRYRLAGDVEVRQSFYTAEFSSESQSLDRLDWQLGALDGGTLLDQIALDVNVRFAEPVRVRNATMRVDLEGSLTASGTMAQPTTDGVVQLREGGELTLGRGRVRVSSGRVVLNGYPAGTPDFDFQGATSVSGIPFTLRARGAIDDLQLTLESDRSELSQTDLLTLLLTGRTASAAASEGGTVVAEQLAVALGGVLQKGVGETLVIDVAPDRSLLTEDTDPTQRMHIGTRITQNVTVLYSVALDGTQQRWIVELNPGGGRFRFRAITEEDNTYTFEGSDRFAFDLWNRGRRIGKAAREVERLASLRIEGSLPVAESELRKATKLKPRRRYSGLQREQAADRVRDRLAREGYRSASVDAMSQPGRGGVDLVLQVEAGPLVAFKWTGDDPGGKTRQAAEEAFTAVAAPEAAAVQVARTALHRAQADGYYGASVEQKTTATEGRVDVALHVALGRKGTSVAVEFDGNKALDDAALVATLPKPGSLEFFEALDPRSERVSSSVRLAYAAIGYLRVRVPAPRSRFDADSGRLAVTIAIRERTAATVASIELPEELRAPDAAPLALKLEQGRPFDLGAYVADRDALVAWYRGQGWIEAQAGSTIETRGGDVAVRYQVDKGPRPRIGSVRVVDGANTRSSLIRRSLKLREGDYLRPTALADSRERLSDVGIYRSVDVRTEPRPPGDELRDVVVGLVAKPDVQVEYGLRYSTSATSGATDTAPTTPSEAQLQGAFAVELNNPFGYGVKARGHTFVTTDRTTWGVGLDAATLLGWRVRTQLFVFDDDEDDDFLLAGIDSRVRGVTLQQSRVLVRDRRSRRWHDRLKLQWGYSFKNIEYFGSEPGVVQLQGYRGFASLAAIGDERDSITDPSRGIFWTATSELARTWLGSDDDYVRLYGQLFAFVPLGPVVWAQGLRVGTVPGENALALIENRFRAGGATTVRGFEQNELGPKGPEGGSLGGQAVVVVNEELRFPIYKSLKGGVFWDAGNVWAFQRELSFKDLRQSVGFGLRYMFPFGPIRLEYAWILGRQEGEPKGRLVFGLGHAF